MGIVSKLWGDGLVGDSPGAVMTISSENSVGAQLRLKNSHNDYVLVSLNVNATGTDRPYLDVKIPEGGHAVINLLDLVDGAVVSASADVAGVVHYFATGGSQT